MSALLMQRGLWSDEEEGELKTMSARMDSLKVDMYGAYKAFQSKRMEASRKTLNKLRVRQQELSLKRHHYDLYTREGLANTALLHYLISQTTKDMNDELVSGWNDSTLSLLLNEYLRNKPSDIVLRSLAKNSQWRMIWASGKQEGRVFGVPSTWLTDEQLGLIAWSKLYDNVHEHSNPPSDEVMEDDDLLDGWLISERKRRDKERSESAGDKKRGHGQEVFIPAETPEDARRIDSMNDGEAAMVKRQRMAMLQRQGSVREQDMPDSKQRIAVQAAQQFRDKMRSK